MVDSVPDPYEHLVEDYDWLFDDDDLRLGVRTPGARVALRSLAPGARILDAACGTGIDAAALTRRGHTVSIADRSPGMLAIATERLRRLGAEFGAVRCTWEELPAHFPAGAFDAVVCTGNSISHLSSEEAMIAAFRGFAAVLVPGGWLVLDTHDWDQVRAAGSRRSADPRAIVRGGRRCTRSSVWHVPREPTAPFELELEFMFEDAGCTSVRTYRLDLHPFSRPELRARLERAGFDRIALDAIPGHDRYSATARAGEPGRAT